MVQETILFIGAAGEMCRVAIETLTRHSPDINMLLADINIAAVEKCRTEKVVKDRKGSVEVLHLDLFDRKALHAVVAQDFITLVVLGAGPYHKTSTPVIEACLSAGKPYLDFDDEVESTLEAQNFDTQARKRGIPLYIGCGASPGMTNMMVMSAASLLDKVASIDVGWLVGDERKGVVGKAVLEHLLHIAAGPCQSWEKGKPYQCPSWTRTYDVAIATEARTRMTRLHEASHPEPVTLPILFPAAKHIRCFGGLDPSPINGVARGLAKAIEDGKLTTSEAVSFLSNLIHTPASATGIIKGLWYILRDTSAALRSVYPALFVLKGLCEQVQSGETSLIELSTFLIQTLRDQTAPYRAGLWVEVRGLRNGQNTKVIKRTPIALGAGAFNMGALTGACCAAFIVMALREPHIRSKGTLAPERWADPQLFFKILHSFDGVPSMSLVETW